ncbi:MAG: hypothetical protein QM679_10110 [Patulibacter sp.]
MTEPTFLRTACSECRSAISLETTGYQPHLVSIAASTCAGWLCDECSEERDRAEQSERDRDAAGKAQLEHRTAISRSRVPDLPRDFLMPTGEAAEAALRWAQRRSLSLLLHGSVGSGKSVLAAWAFRSRLAPVVVDGVVRAKPGAWRSMAGYIAQLGASFGTPEKDDAVWLSKGGIVLALDDLDKTTPSEFAASAVYALVNAAYETRSPLIVTTNSSPIELARRFPGHWGDAITSRLLEGDVVAFNGPDRRLTRSVA